MTTVRRLKVVSAVVLVAAIATCAHVLGDSPKDKANAFLKGNVPAPPPRVEDKLADALAATKFTNRSLIVYETREGEKLFAWQVQPKLDAPAARPRDLVILVDTAASQARAPLQTAREIVKELVSK